MLKYEKLSDEMALKIESDRKNGSMPDLGFDEANVIRRNNERDRANIIRTAFTVILTRLFTVHTITVTQIKHRCFLFIKTMIFLAEVCMCSWFQGSQGPSEKRLT